jgi:hypothetical protein
MNRRTVTAAVSLVTTLAVLLPAVFCLTGCKKEESLEGEVHQGAKTRDEATRIQQESAQRATEGTAVLDGK